MMVFAYSLINTSPAAGSGMSNSTTLVDILPGWSYIAALYLLGSASPILAFICSEIGGIKLGVF